ncbi:putative deacetylase LmbE-like domain-containing protein, partial [Daedaleopsis nitida]
MFFAPTLLALQEATSQPAPRLHSLCLSVGNADGLGGIRRHELARSLDVLGIGKGRRWVVDHPELQDNFTAHWDVDIIATVLRPYIFEHDISMILTFDRHGISSHPNHISLPRGVSRLLSSLPTGSQKPRPRLFTLVTVPLHEKYMGLISPLLSKASIAFPARPDTTEASQATVVSSWAGYLQAHRAMREHRSQLVWFRWLYVSFSRYMWVNEWVEVMPSSDAQVAAAP